jgi:hypothetical protein
VSANDNYLQFPLCALAIVDEPATLLDVILSYGLTMAGYSIVKDWPDDEREALFDDLGLPDGVETGFEQLQLMGAEKCGLILGDQETHASEYHRLRTHRDDWEARHGKDCLVRIKTDLCLEVRDGRGMSFREFRVLCAIYSVIGRSAYRRITLDTVRVRASGCKTAAVMKAEAAAGRPLPEPLTPKQVRATIAHLHERGWFARVTPNPHGRATYYSHRMDADALRERLFQRSIYARKFHEEQRRKDADLAARIQNAKAGFAALPRNLECSSCLQKVTSPAAQRAPAGHL